MTKALNNIEPKEVWHYFSKLNAVPRPSKKEEKVIQFMVNFGKEHQLHTTVDEVGNVIIKKPATIGMEDKVTVVLQSHLDMVHQQNNDTHFDFEQQGIEMFVDGDWVKAKGTTLGADNGLGVAAIMAILASKTIAHPAIEALFTIDEETGMTGAKGLKGGLLEGKILLNLDTEEDNEIGIGCAGGIDVTATGNYKEIETPSNCLGYKIIIKGLQGGHSGMDIHKGLGNANKLLGRILNAIQQDCYLAQFKGGSLRNAIPRESEAIIAYSLNKKEQILNTFNIIKQDIIKEFRLLEPNLFIDIQECDCPQNVMENTSFYTFLKVLIATLNGVYRMSPAIKDLVETSNNVAKVTVFNKKVQFECLTRSSVESSKTDLVQTLMAVFKLADYQVNTSGDYPGWEPNPDSAILKVMEQLYVQLFKEKPHVAACHAGLECGILGKNYPLIDMISFGPTIKGAHSPDEKASVSSTQKFWLYLQEILKNIPAQ